MGIEVYIDGSRTLKELMMLLKLNLQPDRVGVAENTIMDLFEGKLSAECRASEDADSWPSSDEDDLDFSPKKTSKPSLTQLLHTKKNRKGKLENQGRKKSNSKGSNDCAEDQNEDEQNQKADEECEDEEIRNDEDDDEDESKDCEEAEEDCEDDDDEEEEDQEDEEDGDVSESHEDNLEKENDKSGGENSKICIKDGDSKVNHVPEGMEGTSGFSNNIESDHAEMIENKLQSYSKNALPSDYPKNSDKDTNDPHVCSEVPVSLIFGLPEHDEIGTPPMESEVTQLKTSFKSQVQTNKQVTSTSRREDCNKKTSKCTQPCIAVDRMMDREDGHTQNSVSQYPCEDTEQLDSNINRNISSQRR
ncbi:uncharacterized protein [Dendrobates tinctorius]|uniref:uncharacterized protein n=1 Tax=Dendrobates tinctorius TaxID=92724 RepID=UPI003CC9538E